VEHLTTDSRTEMPASAIAPAAMPLDLLVEPKADPRAGLEEDAQRRSDESFGVLGGHSWPLRGCATAFCLGAERFGQIANLTAIRFGGGGVVADAAEEIPPGAAVSLGFEAPGYHARRGEVVACRPGSEGFRIAIRFDARLAA
jgi:hypothetical protein